MKVRCQHHEICTNEECPHHGVHEAFGDEPWTCNDCNCYDCYDITIEGIDIREVRVVKRCVEV